MADTTPQRARTSSPSTAGSRPNTRTVPASGEKAPVMVRMAVVLPAPFGPEQHGDLSARDGQAQIVEGPVGAEGLHHPVEDDDGRGRRHRGDGTAGVARDRGHARGVGPVAAPLEIRAPRGPQTGTVERVYVLGIDPGLSRCGYGIVHQQAAGVRATAVGVLRTAPTAPDRPTPGRAAERPPGAAGGAPAAGGRHRAGALPGERAHRHPGGPGRRDRHGRSRGRRLRGRRVLARTR